MHTAWVAADGETPATARTSPSVESPHACISRRSASTTAGQSASIRSGSMMAMIAVTPPITIGTTRRFIKGLSQTHGAMYPDYNILKYAPDAEGEFVAAVLVPLLEAVRRAMETAIPPLPMLKYRACLEAQFAATREFKTDSLVRTELRYCPIEIDSDPDASPVPDSVVIGTEILDFVVDDSDGSGAKVAIRVLHKKEYGAGEGCAELARKRERLHRGICGVEGAGHGVLAVVDQLNATVDLWLVNRGGRFEPIEPGWDGVQLE